MRRDGSVRLKTHGRRVRMTDPKPGTLEITVGARDADGIDYASDRGSRGMGEFR